MHHIAEYGIAAHWKYKEGQEAGGNGTGKVSARKEEEKLTWLRQILEWQQESDNKEFLSLLKSDLNLFNDSVYCFTPAGDVKTLPNGSTPIDFAYSIHSAVGNRMVGARVNGKLVTIDYVIQNGDRIEILTSQNSKGPSRDWLKIVRSTQAKNKINQWFKQEKKEDNIVRGREAMAAYARAKGLNLPDLLKIEYTQICTLKYGFRDWDSILAAIGHGGLKEGQIVNKLYELWLKDHKKEQTDEDILGAANPHDRKKITQSRSGVIVRGLSDISVRLSKCCSPVPGDEIVGFITRGRGVTVHRTDCVNIMHMPQADQERLIDVEWADRQGALSPGKLYLAEIKIYARNRTGLLMDITKIFTERRIDVQSVTSRATKQGMATIIYEFEVPDSTTLKNIIEKIRQVESVIDIDRTTG
jgi:GTP pyrophosphokinase